MKRNRSGRNVLDHFRQDVNLYINEHYVRYCRGDDDMKRAECIRVYAEELIDRWQKKCGAGELPDMLELLGGCQSWREVHESGLSPKGDEHVRDAYKDAGMSTEELSELQGDLLEEAADDAMNWSIWNIEDVFSAYMPWDLPDRLFFNPWKFFHYRRKWWQRK